MAKLRYDITTVLSRLSVYRAEQLEYSIAVLLTDNYEIFDVLDISKISEKSSITPDFAELNHEMRIHECRSFIYVHNHPNGICIPSELDRKLTYYIYNSYSGSEFKFIDHIIITEIDYYSFREKGKISKHPSSYIF